MTDQKKLREAYQKMWKHLGTDLESALVRRDRENLNQERERLNPQKTLKDFFENG